MLISQRLNIGEMSVLPKRISRVDVMSVRTPACPLTDRRLILTLTQKGEGTRVAKAIPKNSTKLENLTLRLSTNLQ